MVAGSNPMYYNIEECASEEMCCFLATLMHSEITTLHLPPLNSTLPLMDFSFKWRTAHMYKSPAGEALMSLKELHDESCGVLMLINAIGAQCPRLKCLHIMDLSWHAQLVPLIPLNEGSIFGTAFFQVLPRLTSLKMEYYLFGDWALKQIATHATNLV
jgi:hypothetical protein